MRTIQASGTPCVTSCITHRLTTLTEEQENEILISMKYHINGIIALLEFWEQNHPEKDIDALISRAARLANEGPLTVIKEIVL